MESTYNWYWLVDGLMAAGYRVHLANTTAIEQYKGLKHTDDESDARWLAHLLRLGILPEGYIYPKEERAVRDLLRKRSQLVRQRTTNLLSIQNLLTRNTGSSLSGNRIKQLTVAEVEQLLPQAELALAVKSNLAVLQCLEEQIEQIEEVVLAQLKLRERISALTHGQWDWADSRHDDHVGDRGDWAFCDGRRFCLLLSVCRQSEIE